MSKKKIRKPKKRAPVKRSNDVLSSHFGDDLYIQDGETGKTVNVSELIRNYKNLTEVSDLHYVYETYRDPSSPLHDPKKAAKVLERMSAMGDVHSYVLKGVALFNEGKEKEALPYLKKGIEVNDSDANYYYGLYLNHQKDYKNALVYYEKASAQGEPSGSFNAFILYFQTDEVKDPKKAQYYLNQAFNQGHPKAAAFVLEGNLLNPIDHIDEDMAILGLDWDVKHKRDRLLFKLEYTYIMTKMSDTHFFDLLRRLKNDDRIFHKLMAECYLFGIGTKADAPKALKHFKELTDHDPMVKTLVKHLDVNDPLGSMIKGSRSTKACCYYAGKMFMYGSYGEVDIDRAVQYLEKGISKNYPATQNALAHIYLWNESYQDYIKAREMLESNQGFFSFGEDLMRLKDLYTIYTLGLGVNKDLEKANAYADEVALHAMFK